MGLAGGLAANGQSGGGGGGGSSASGIRYVDVIGHSIPAGFELTNATNNFAQKIADALGATCNNQAVTGASLLHNGVAQGGWAKVLNSAFKRSSRTAAIDDAQVPNSQLVIIHYGDNDVGKVAPALRSKYVAHGFRAAISNMLAWTRWEENHASVVYTGSWSATAGNTDYLSNSTGHQATANGAVATITVPAKVPAGSTLAFIILADGTGKGICTVAKNGVNVGVVPGTTTGGVIDATDSFSMVPVVTPPSGLPCVARIPNVNPGDTITLTASSINAATGWWLDNYWVEAAPANWPLVMVVRHTHLTTATYANWSTDPFAPLTDTDVDQMNTITDAVIAEFASPRIFGLDISSLAPISQYQVASNDPHWNVLGHAKVAQLGYSAVLSAIAAGGWSPTDALLAARE